MVENAELTTNIKRRAQNNSVATSTQNKQKLSCFVIPNKIPTKRNQLRLNKRPLIQLNQSY